MVFDVKQDRKGFLWIATKDGLNRYDGNNFNVLTHNPYDEFSLSENSCTALLIDRHERLWVGTMSQGINLMDAETGRFFHLDLIDPTVRHAGNYEIKQLAEDPDGNIWVNTNKDLLFKLTLPPSLQTSLPTNANITRQVRVQQLRLSGKFPNGKTHWFQFKSDGQATIGTTNGLFTFNWKQPLGVSQLNPNDDPDGYFSTSDVARADYWFSATVHAIHVWHKGHYKRIPLSNPTKKDVQLLFYDDQTLVIVSNTHCWMLSPQQLMQLEHLSPLHAIAPGPTNVNFITTLLRDQTGLIWAATAGYGLRRFNPHVSPFQTYLPGQSLSYLYQDRQGRVYARSSYQFKRIDLKTNQTTPLPIGLSQAIQFKTQLAMLQGRQNDFWLLYEHSSDKESRFAFARFSQDWAFKKTYLLPPDVQLNNFVGSPLLEDKAGTIWIGADNGILLRFNPTSGQTHTYNYSQLLPQQGAQVETQALHFDPAGTLWIGTAKGLIRVDNPLQKPHFFLYANSPTNRFSLSNNAVSSLADDPYEPSRYLWVGTKGGGLERLDKQSRNAGTGPFEHFTQAQGLPNQVVYGILTDSQRNFWISTNRGIVQFNPQTHRFQPYSKADGLQDDEFNTGSFFKAPTGELLFGGINGLTRFRPEAVTHSGAPLPHVQIVGIKVNNQLVVAGGKDGILSAGIEYSSALDLAHDQNLLTLEFGMMDYTSPNKNRYRYRVIGVNDAWVEAGTNRFANYAQLPPGHYTLQVMGCVDSDTWSQPVSLTIRVRPPFYRTWWAYLLYVLGLGLAVWQAHRFQTQRLLLKQQVVFEREEAARLTELDTLKTQFFTNISHEVRTPLTLILGPLTDLRRQFPGESMFDLMERNGHRLLRLINQLLDLSKLEAGQLQRKFEPVDLPFTLRALANSFESLAASRAVSFFFSQVETSRWFSFDRDKLESIVANLLSNAFKFTPAGRAVRMQVKYEDQLIGVQLIIQIEDEGIGIAPDKLSRIFDRFYQVDGQANRAYEGTGIGLALVKELVQVLGGTIHVQSTEGVGTTFTVRLPAEAYQVTGLPTSGSFEQPVLSSYLDLTQQPDSGLMSGTTQSTKVTASPDGTAPILLLVDDNADIRAYIRSMFGDAYQLVEAEDGQQGLELATQHAPDLIICDLMMPQLDGFAFCRALKTQEATSHIPMVMLTAKNTPQDRLEGLEIGADDYLAKPFNREELRVRVRNLLDKQKRLQHYYGSQLTGSSPVLRVAETSPLALSREDVFLQRTRQLIERHLADSTFGVEAFSEGMHLSPSQLLRKSKALTGLTTVEYLRQYRLERAAQLLEARNHTVTEVAFEVGFQSSPYFTKAFRDHYGVLPSAYGKETIA